MRYTTATILCTALPLICMAATPGDWPRELIKIMYISFSALALAFATLLLLAFYILMSGKVSPGAVYTCTVLLVIFLSAHLTTFAYLASAYSPAGGIIYGTLAADLIVVFASVYLLRRGFKRLQKQAG